jgi:hypothetical protein
MDGGQGTHSAGRGFGGLDINKADEASLVQSLDATRAKFEVGTQTQADLLLADNERQKIIETRRDLNQKRRANLTMWENCNENRIDVSQAYPGSCGYRWNQFLHETRGYDTRGQ